MTMIGHNNGPTLEGGQSWRRHAWGKARAALLPTLPIEVVRLRLKRAAEIGLDYRTYASIRAASGHDVIAFLFSTNALHMLAHNSALPDERRQKLEAMRGVVRVGLANAPLLPETVARIAAAALDQTHGAPRPFASWSEARAVVQAVCAPQKWPSDRVVMIGDTFEERAWAEAARLAYYLPADKYFAA